MDELYAKIPTSTLLWLLCCRAGMLTLGAQIPRRTQPSSGPDSAGAAANGQQLDLVSPRRQRDEAAGEAPSPPSLHTHRPPRFSVEAVGGAADTAQTEAVGGTGAAAAPALPSPRHLADGVPYLLPHTESDQPAAERRFALPAGYDAGQYQGDADDASMDQNHSTDGDSSDDGTAGEASAPDYHVVAAGGGGVFCQDDEDAEDNWGPSAERRIHTHRGTQRDTDRGAQPLQSEAASFDLATATRLNRELQSQLAVQSTLLQTDRLAAQAARNRSPAAEKKAPERRERHSLGVPSRWDTGELVAAAPHNLDDAVDELRTALTAANAARRAAEDTIAHMTSAATGTERQQFGSWLGSAGLAPRAPSLVTDAHSNSFAGGRGAQILRQHSQTDRGRPSSHRSHQSGVQLHEVLRQRWVARQEARRW